MFRKMCGTTYQKSQKIRVELSPPSWKNGGENGLYLANRKSHVFPRWRRKLHSDFRGLLICYYAHFSEHIYQFSALSHFLRFKNEEGVSETHRFSKIEQFFASLHLFFS